jgi:acyl-coenzyme A thioesterase PaaI-like protein
VISGQVFMAAADVAMWLAIKTQLGIADASVTAELQTTFLRGGRRSVFACTARVLKLGQRLIFGVAECRDANRHILTHHTITYIRQPAANGVRLRQT